MTSRFLYLVRHGAATAEGELSEAGGQQARLTGQRLKGRPFSAIHHSPVQRAAQTAALIAEYLPSVPVLASDLLADFIPSSPDPSSLPPSFARLVTQYSITERNEGPALAMAAAQRYARPGEPGEQEIHELIVTHNFLIGWFVRQAMDAPDWRWLGLNQQNCALTVIMYRTGMPAALVSYNDAGHLPPELRWTGFPAGLRPTTG